MFASAAIPVFFALAAIVLDVGNWYVHKRHLQTQVDAAALAGGGEFVRLLPRPANCVTSVREGGSTEVRGRRRGRVATSERHDEPARSRSPNDVRVVLNGSQVLAARGPAADVSADSSSDGDPYGLDWQHGR